MITIIISFVGHHFGKRYIDDDSFWLSLWLGLAEIMATVIIVAMFRHG